MTTEQKVNIMNFLDLDSKVQTELIEAFSKRFPNARSRDELLDDARIPWPKQTENSWENIFFCLANNPILLKKLLYTAVQTYPYDQNLKDIVSLLAPNRTLHRNLGQGIAIFAGAACALFVYSQFNQNIETLLTSEPQESQTELVQAQEDNRLKEFSTPIIKKEVNEDALVSLVQQKHNSLTEVQVKEDDVEEVAVIPVQPALPQGSSTRCNIEGNGELIGYWYAGATPPEVDDGWISLDNGRNVRLDYPDVHNGYNARATITCILYKNTKIPLDKPAIHVPGNKYWVPLYSNPKG
jgi:hypothetical protein